MDMESSLVIHVADMFSVCGLSFHFLYGIKLVFAEMERNLGIQIVSEIFSARSLCDLLYHLGSSLTILV